MKNNITKVIIGLMLTISVASINYTLKSQDITTHDTQKNTTRYTKTNYYVR